MVQLNVMKVQIFGGSCQALSSFVIVDVTLGGMDIVLI
jgi:hypothetical protein